MSDETAVPQTRRHGRILIVEDDKEVRNSLALMLQSRGYEVIQAEDAAAGFLKTMAMSPDLVVLDIIMPVRSGIALCKKIKKDERTRDIPVLLLSALSEKEQRRERHWKGPPAADDFMSKPYRPRELLDRIDRLLSSKPRKKS